MGWPKKKVDDSLPELKQPKAKSAEEMKQEAILQKAEMDRLRKLLLEKLKDPKMAKKAAMIISEILNKKP